MLEGSAGLGFFCHSTLGKDIVRKISSQKCFWKWNPSLLLEDDLFVGRNRRVTHASSCMNVCAGLAQALQTSAPCLSGENFGMYVQMALPEPHCQGLGVRSSGWQWLRTDRLWGEE